ncbi:MAG: hypothetical protein E6G37_12080 [Actinobacteria bacterium]|nr:MAG: hypothetical protein E6G37_12080 [Actinomycetota bacterium]
MSAIAGIVLAGGGSIRFGSDKLLAPYHGSSLLHRAIERVGEVSDDVIVVMSPAAADPAMPPRAKVVRDASEGEGPLAAMARGMRRRSPRPTARARSRSCSGPGRRPTRSTRSCMPAAVALATSWMCSTPW